MSLSWQRLDLRLWGLILYAEKKYAYAYAFQILTQAQGIKHGFVVLVLLSQWQYWTLAFACDQLISEDLYQTGL